LRLKGQWVCDDFQGCLKYDYCAQGDVQHHDHLKERKKGWMASLLLVKEEEGKDRREKDPEQSKEQSRAEPMPNNQIFTERCEIGASSSS
jgi:hypothetical protein